MRILIVALLLVGSTARAGHHCAEVSETVGERRCTSFGQSWSTERSIPMLASIGGWSSLVRPVGRDVALRGPLQSYGVDVRFGGYFARYGYIALDWGVALGRPAPALTLFHARVGPAVGVRVPLGRVSLRVEGLTALQLLLLSREGKDGGGGAMIAIEPRVALDFWLAPDTTLTTWAGTNLLRSGDSSFGLALAAHVRAFDGAF